jgi:hypothetical protein
MKKLFQLSLMILVLLFAFSNDTYAQRSKKKKKKSTTDQYFDESGSLKTKLWYGGGFTLGYSGGTFERFFQIGISPMVGYKITDKLSAGPRVSFVYTNYRVQFGNDVLTANPVSWDAGVFARYRIIPMIFAQIEYQFENDIQGFDLNSGNELETIRRKRSNFLAGLGYTTSSAGSLLGWEILLLYNTTLPQNVLESPFIIRMGLTYNF